MKELRQRVKNAKPTVNMKELRRRFARQDSGGGGDASKEKSSRNQRAASTAVQDKAGLNDKSADSSGDRKKSSQQTKKASGSTIDAIREAKRKHRLAVKASGRRKADTGKSGADVPVEVFVPPGYSFDLGTSNDTTIYTDGSITRNISVQNISSEQADGHANVSATNSAVDESSRKFKIGETFSIGGNGNQASLQEAFQNRRNARRSKRQSRQIPDALDEFVGSAAGGAGKVDDENSTTVAHTSGKRNPFRRSATRALTNVVYPP